MCREIQLVVSFNWKHLDKTKKFRMETVLTVKTLSKAYFYLPLHTNYSMKQMRI